MSVHALLIVFIDTISSPYPQLSSLKILVPLILLAPWYASLTAVVYEKIKRSEHQ